MNVEPISEIDDVDGRAWRAICRLHTLAEIFEDVEDFLMADMINNLVERAERPTDESELIIAAILGEADDD